jgi:hypothetical protein
MGTKTGRERRPSLPHADDYRIKSRGHSNALLRAARQMRVFDGKPPGGKSITAETEGDGATRASASSQSRIVSRDGEEVRPGRDRAHAQLYATVPS